MFTTAEEFLRVQVPRRTLVEVLSAIASVGCVGYCFMAELPVSASVRIPRPIW
ncbi:hypothetical protein AB0E04_09815 [Streptomyces sp. NPDC048251]|uniref:hypothetical protein n=1 Tax=Streptomyces sp. NPDC048251 TaxID=3154501 RepID=UPI00341FEC77